MENTVQNPFDEMDFFDSFEVNVDPEETMWNALIGKIIDGKVIPVIGPDFLSDQFNLHKALIHSFAKKYGVTSFPSSFSELVYDDNYLNKNEKNKDSIYTLINEVCKVPQQPASLLKSLLESKLFPFVITTSFFPVVEQVMGKIWKNDLRIMSFNNHPQEKNDINNESDLTKPTIFYMFGRVGDTRPNRYVVTDQDMLDFCSSWLSGDKDRVPHKLLWALKDKFLLMLGTDYSDWLFRFIWYSVRKESELKSENNDLISNNVELEESFIKFMKRNNTYLKNTPGEVVRQILDRMEIQYEQDPHLRKRLTTRITTKFSYPEEKTDIFLSYSRRDSEFTEKLYEALTDKGLNVWYDKNNLTDGGKFMTEIKQAIKTAKYFVPILTHNIEEEKNEDHVYRYEWDIACEVRVGRTYIIPVSERKFDFYRSGVNEKIQSHNAIEFDTIEDVNNVAEKIIIKYESENK